MESIDSDMDIEPVTVKKTKAAIAAPAAKGKKATAKAPSNASASDVEEVPKSSHSVHLFDDMDIDTTPTRAQSKANAKVKKEPGTGTSSETGSRKVSNEFCFSGVRFLIVMAFQRVHSPEVEVDEEEEEEEDADGDTTSGSQGSAPSPAAAAPAVARKPPTRKVKKGKGFVEPPSDVEMDTAPAPRKKRNVADPPQKKRGRDTTTLEEEMSWDPECAFYAIATYQIPCDGCIVRRSHGEFTRTCIRSPWDFSNNRTAPKVSCCYDCKQNGKGCIRSGYLQAMSQLDHLEPECDKLLLDPEEAQNVQGGPMKTKEQLKQEFLEVARRLRKQYLRMKKVADLAGLDMDDIDVEVPKPRKKRATANAKASGSGSKH